MKRDLSKYLKRLVTLLICAFLLVMIVKLANTFRITLTFPFLNSLKQEEPFSSKVITVSPPSSGGTYYVRFTNVTGSADRDGGSQNVYYNMDITMKTSSRALADKIQANPEGALSVIRRTLSTFRREDMANENGRAYVKNTLKQTLSQRYGTNEIDDIYLEKFLYQRVP